MILPDHAVEVELEVPFHDVDGQRVVWHGHYLKYFEIARTKLMRSMQLDVAEILDCGNQLVVVESGCRHIRPLVYGERFQVAAWFVEVDVALKVRSLARNWDGERVAKGNSTLAVLDQSGELHLKVPDAIRQRLPR